MKIDRDYQQGDSAEREGDNYSLQDRLRERLAETAGKATRTKELYQRSLLVSDAQPNIRMTR